VIHEADYHLREIKIEVTHDCPLACIHCSSTAGPHSGRSMSLSDAADLVRQAAEMRVEEVAFSGGEPLVWPGLGRLVTQCSEARMRSVVYTSGNVVDVQTQLVALAHAGLTRLIFSVFARDPRAHDTITGSVGSLAATLMAVSMAIDLGHAVEFHYVPLRVNLRHFLDVTDLAIDLGVLKVSVLRFVPQGRGRKATALCLTHEQNVELKNMIISAGRRVAVRTGSPYNFLQLNEKARCAAAVDRLSIAPDARVYPCDAFKRIEAERVVATDVLSRVDRWSLRECWEKSPYLQLVRKYLNTPFPEPCASCKARSRCQSGCLAQKYLANGNLKKAPDPMCLMGEVP